MSFATAKWKPTNFLAIILLLQCTLYSTIIFNIPVARQIIGFLYLTFIPGLVLIRLIRLKELDTIETVLFSVGLSIGFLMLTGFFINALYPVFGITQPLSATYTLITQSVIILIGAILSQTTCEGIKQPSFNIKTLLALTFSLVLTILGVLGILILNTTKNNIIPLILILSVSLMFLISAISKKINPKFYPLILYTSCVLLLFFTHSNDTSLVTNYIIGEGDQWIEYQAFKLTETHHYWNYTMPPSPYSSALFPTYSMISVTILPTIFSQTLQLDPSWTMKILYPFIVSFMALGTYKLYTTQTNSKMAFLASFFFITISAGKGWGSAKQTVAQLFYTLLFILIFDKKITLSKKRILFIIFSFALVTSHYALSYIFAFTMLSFLLILTLANYLKKDVWLTHQSESTLILLIIYLTIAISWSIYVNASESFNLLLNTINTVIKSVDEFLEPQARGTALQGIGIVETPTILHQISAFLFLLTEFFILIGILRLIIKREEIIFEQNYKLISILNVALIAMNLLLPRLADTFLMSRFYQTTLIILAPIGILGGQTILENIPKVNHRNISASILALTVLIPLFLFQTGFIYEVSNVESESLPLNMHRWDDLKLHAFIVEAEEVTGAIWLYEHVTTQKIFVHSDIISKFHVLTAYSLIERGQIFLLSNTTRNAMNKNEFIYLGYTTMINGKIRTQLPNGYYEFNTTELSPIIENQNKIYSSGKCEIYNGYLPQIFP